MSKCESCKRFLMKRRSAIQETTKLPYSKEEKQMIYYDYRITDQEFETNSIFCSECFDDLCNTISQEIPVTCEEIKQYLMYQMPVEKRNRENRRSNIEKRFENTKLQMIKDSNECKVCETYGKMRSNFVSVKDGRRLNEENMACGKCLELCESKSINDPYCIKTREQKINSDRDLEYFNLETKNKLLNIELMKKRLEKK
jgi:hypothetical protein